jgi:hypothetical protein
MIACSVEKDLRLVFQSSERAGMNDAIAVALIMGPPLGRFFRISATPGIGAELSVWREILPFQVFEFQPRARHAAG